MTYGYKVKRIKIADNKSDKLLGSPDEDNQQPI